MRKNLKKYEKKEPHLHTSLNLVVTTKQIVGAL